MPPTTGILTNLLNIFLTIFSGGYAGVMPDAQRFLFLIAGIELTVVALFWALRGENFFAELIQKLLKIGVFAFFVLNWPAMVNAVVQGFVGVGSAAGASGGGGAVNAIMTDPSAIVTQAFTITAPIFTKMQSLSWYAVGDILVYMLAALLILLAFFILAIQVALTYLEFYMVAVLSLALVPFGVNRYTSFLAEKAIGAIIGFGVKLMVLSFIISAAGPTIAALTMPADPTYQDLFTMLLGASFITFLAWHAPGIAAGMMSGGPSLTAGTVARTGVAAGIAGAAVASGGAAAVGRAAAGGATAVRAATRSAGVVASGAQMGSTMAAASGAGRMGQVAGGIRGAAASTAGAARNAATAPVRSATEALKQDYTAGQVTGWRGMGFPAQPTAPSAAAAGAAGPAAGGSSMLNRIHRAGHVVPPEASPMGGGMNPSIGG